MTQRYRWNENVEAVEVERHWVILHAEHNTITKLNETGDLVWSMLQHGHDVASIVAVVAEQFDVDPGRAQEDIEEFLSELEKVDVIVSAE